MYIDAYTLPPDKLIKAVHLAHIRNVIAFGSTAWTILALWLALRFRIVAALRDSVASLTSRRWLQGTACIAAFLVALSLVPLPFEIWGHSTSLAYGLSIEAWPLWIADWAKSTLLTIGIGTPLILGLFALVRRFPRSWWFLTWLITLPLQVAAIFLTPYVIDPLFNHFEPLVQSNPALVEQLERVVAKSGADIPPERMFLMNASEKVTSLNAYVTGFGNSKRIVIWDTTIARMSPDEILFTFGHEEGHYALNHILKGLLLSAVFLFFGLLLGYLISKRIVKSRGVRWRITGLDDWAALGIFALVFTVFGFLAEPVANAFSRIDEHHADIYGQEVIHGIVNDPQQTSARAFQALGEVSLDDPCPNHLAVFWSYSHPSIAQRTAFAAHYDPWRPGAHPRYFAAESSR